LKIENSIKSIAIGSFDGVHIAHKKLLEKAEAVVVIEHKKGGLTPGFKRVWYCKKPMYFFMLHHIKNLSPEQFLIKLLELFPNLNEIIIGYDFKFAKDRSGDIEDIKRNFKKKVYVVDEVKFNGVSVHSKEIQKALLNGNLNLANGMLGRFYKIDGRVVQGQGLGKKELFPTINIKTENYTLPKYGVYASFCQIGKKRFKSVTFLGNRVSTDNAFSLETHILDENLLVELNSKVFIEFVERIRGNRKFDNFTQLKRAIESDIQKVREILGKN